MRRSSSASLLDYAATRRGESSLRRDWDRSSRDTLERVKYTVTRLLEHCFLVTSAHRMCHFARSTSSDPVAGFLFLPRQFRRLGFCVCSFGTSTQIRFCAVGVCVNTTRKHFVACGASVEELYPTPHIHEQMTAYIMATTTSTLSQTR